MPKSDRNISPEEVKQIQEKIGEMAKHALIEAGDLRDFEERLKAIVERSQKASDASQQE